MIGARGLALAKSSAHLVNVARGAIVDEKTLGAVLVNPHMRMPRGPDAPIQPKPANKGTSPSTSRVATGASHNSRRARRFCCW
jgi:D-isomer specific 2-hydroxyacid dehydrogenase-like protein